MTFACNKFQAYWCNLFTLKVSWVWVRHCSNMTVLTSWRWKVDDLLPLFFVQKWISEWNFFHWKADIQGFNTDTNITWFGFEMSELWPVEVDPELPNLRSAKFQQLLYWSRLRDPVLCETVSDQVSLFYFKPYISLLYKAS